MSGTSTSQLLSLAGKIALITGASGGIGSAVVSCLKDAGAYVIGVDRPEAGASGADEDRPCDLTDHSAITSLMGGLERLEILIHCAGIRRDAVLWKMEDADWSDVMNINLDAAFHLLKHGAPLLRASGGSIVLVSSINGERGKFGQSNYAASKAGLIGLGRSAAKELGRFGVRVNMVSPGYTRTTMTETLPEKFIQEAIRESALDRMGEPSDVAGVILFLCSNLSRHVTGQVIRVDGGQLIA